MHRGFIVLHRKMLEWEWYNDANTFRLFVHLLLTANHKPSKYKGRDINRGQKVFGRSAAAQALKMSEQNVRTAIEHLKSTGEVTIESTGNFSVITLINYGLYQDKNSELISKATSNLTNDQPTTNQQLTTSKQCNNENNETKKIYTKEAIAKEKTNSNTTIEKPKRKKTSDAVDSEFINKLKALYPAINVEAEKRKADAWLLCNPGRVMTRRFFNSWLSRAKPEQISTNIENEIERLYGGKS